MKKTISKKTKIILIVLCAVVVIIIAGLYAVAVIIYNDNFNKRFESYEPLMLYIDDFEGLERTQYQFPSDKGQLLTGYMYSFGEDQHGIVVMAHGFGGGGHNSYMDCANRFARSGYYVFAYDATGNDESEGEAVGGLPQGVIDLDHAIDFVEESGNFPDLPIVLFGHSWGAYSVCSVLSYHPEVKAAVECAGFDRSLDMIEAQGKKLAGNGVYLLLPFIKLHESIKFGEYAQAGSMKGFADSDTPVMAVHSADDDTVPIEYGYDIYYEKYSDDPRFDFVRFEDSGHNYVYCDLTYVNEFNAGFDKWLETLDYDHNAEENKERFAEDKAAYINSNLDRIRWCDILNDELFDRFVSFYDEYTGADAVLKKKGD